MAAGILANFGVIIDPAVGAILMSFSTVLVAINSQTLRRYEPKGDIFIEAQPMKHKANEHH